MKLEYASWFVVDDFRSLFPYLTNNHHHRSLHLGLLLAGHGQLDVQSVRLLLDERPIPWLLPHGDVVDLHAVLRSGPASLPLALGLVAGHRRCADRSTSWRRPARDASHAKLKQEAANATAAET